MSHFKFTYTWLTRLIKVSSSSSALGLTVYFYVLSLVFVFGKISKKTIL